MKTYKNNSSQNDRKGSKVEIVDIILSKGFTGYYLDDKHAIQKGATLDGNFYFGETATDGFTTIRQPGESVSFMMVIDDGQISYGDCATGQYSGIGGRDKPFFADDLIKLVEFSKDAKLEKTYLDYDRHLLVQDVRYKEVNKPGRSKARSKRQKSYR